MEVISVNVGKPREAMWKGQTFLTSIFKDPVDGPVPVRGVNLAGDQQSDLTVHGGPDKAVYGYPSEHYEYWAKELPGVALPWGVFGENLTTKGLLETDLYVGDRLRVGSATLMVTQPRQPCFKLAMRFQSTAMIKRFRDSLRSGFYFTIVEDGEVEVGSKIEVISRDPHRVSITDVMRLYSGQIEDRELARRAVGTSALPEGWRAKFEEMYSLQEGRIRSGRS